MTKRGSSPSSFLAEPAGSGVFSKSRLRSYSASFFVFFCAGMWSSEDGSSGGLMEPRTQPFTGTQAREPWSHRKEGGSFDRHIDRDSGCGSRVLALHGH